MVKPIGLSFFMTTGWDGTERRKVNQEDHDLLTRIDANLTNHIDLVRTHIEDDTIKFKKIDDDLGWMRKILYGGIGVYIFLQFVNNVK